MLAETAAAWFACKAVLSAAEARACRSFEFDVSLTTDGVLVVSHDPVPYAFKDVQGRLVDLDSFVAGLGERRFEHVNVDVKERSLWFGDGALSAAFARHKKALETLGARTSALVVSSPVPARFEEIERWLSSNRVHGKAGYELADYDAAQSARWGLPLSLVQRLLLPLGRFFNRVYLERRARTIAYVMVQEATAAAGHLPAGPAVVCWTRDPASGPPPSVCRWSQRHKE